MIFFLKFIYIYIYIYKTFHFVKIITSIISGCISDRDCMDGKECDVDTYQCVPLTCKEMTSKIGGSIEEKDATPKWFVGDTAEFCCEEGILHYD